jgi:hypothetical protein
MKTTHQDGKKIVWIAAALVLVSVACNLTVATPEPTMTIPRAQPAEHVPTAQPAELAPTAQPIEPTPTPEPPTVEIFSDQVETEILIGDAVEIAYLAQGKNGIPRIVLTLDSIDGQVLDSDGIPDAQGETSLRDTFTWTPDKPGEYSVFLTAYDTQERASAPATLTITVFPRPKIIATGFVFLRAEDSIDFVSGEIGNLTGGDLYIYRASASDYRTLANNVPQIGGQLLFDADKAVTMDVEVYDASHFVTNTETLKKISAASTQSNFTFMEVPLETYAVYLYQRNQTPGDYVLFTVADIEPDGVALDYAVFEMPD